MSTIESLMGTVGMKRIVGMLGEDERKRLYLEDTTARICIDLSSAVRKSTNFERMNIEVYYMYGRILMQGSLQ